MDASSEDPVPGQVSGKPTLAEIAARHLQNGEWCADCGQPWPCDAHIQSEMLTALRLLVEKQAEDEGLWFIARTAPEAYLQQELRRLHAAIESAAREAE